MNLKRALNVGYGASRVAFGMVAGAYPAKVGRTWIGASADKPENKVIFRALAGRDIAIGAGTIEGALRDEADVWLAIAALADIGDVTATLISRNDLENKGVIITSILASSAAAAGIGLLVLGQMSD
ncbi:MAG: hypothetical protein ACSLFI_11595 [Solirubrobacterales bacterium]